MKQLLVFLLLGVGAVLAGCESLEQRESRDVRWSDALPQVEVTVQQ